MFLKNLTTPSTKSYFHQINSIQVQLSNADAIVVGAGAGLSTAAGLTYAGERFERHFADFIKKYHFTDMYSAGFYPYDSLEEYWAYWSRHIFYNRYADLSTTVYKNLLELIKEKNYFIITTNVDHQFQLAGFDKNRLFYTQGDYGLWQCSEPCHAKTYHNEQIVQQMMTEQRNMLIPSKLIPFCPLCKKPMANHLRCDNTFVQDEGWQVARNRYKAFIHQHQHRHLVFLELGVGYNTPAIIKYPFWQMTLDNVNARYISINLNDQTYPEQITKQTICLNADIKTALMDIKSCL